MKWYEDERAIGLKYKFLNNGKVFNVESVKVYKGILYIDNIGAGRVGTNDWTKTIQLVQGDKTPYDGKSQPVPDGVDITLFFIHKLPETRKAETVDWEDGTFKYYQVQEMPEEKQTRTKIPTGATSVVNAATGEKIALNAKTVSIKQATIDEVVECLEVARPIHVSDIKMAHRSSDMSWECSQRMIAESTERIAAIDKIIKELKGE